MQLFQLGFLVRKVIKANFIICLFHLAQIHNAHKVKIVLLEPKQPIYVNADKVRIYQVISNLLNNAIKFTEDGAISIDINIKDKHEVVISIKDTGTGINPEIMAWLFTKFATKSDTGTGLGLFISKAIIEGHSGKIWAENNPDGKGATFAFSIPLNA